MADRKVEEFAYRNDVSNSQAKRMMKARPEKQEKLPQRGMVVPGTGKQKGASKG